MKNTFFIITAILLSQFNLFAQVQFVPGFFINENDQRIDCFIKNTDNISSPTQFSYKLTLDGAVNIATLEDVKEFEMVGIAKFIKQNIKIDISTDDLNLMVSDRNPTFKKEVLFLEVLVKGEASLYSYHDGLRPRLFFQVKNEPIEQLIYKRYLVGGMVAKNNFYKQQIFKNLTCETITLKEIEKLDYFKNDLEALFHKYNKCVDPNYVSLLKSDNKIKFNLSLRPGLNSSNFEFTRSTFINRDYDFGNKQNFRLGLEAELVFPFNNNKWALIFEPTYQYFNATNRFDFQNIPDLSENVTLNFNSIELPIGVRHYFFLSNQAKIFVNASYVVDFSFNSKLEIANVNNPNRNELEILSSNSLSLGLGFKLKNRYSVEFRHFLGRNLISKYLTFDSNYQTTSFIIGYQLF